MGFETSWTLSDGLTPVDLVEVEELLDGRLS